MKRRNNRRMMITDDDMLRFALNLRAVRKFRGYTQSDLAERAGLTNASSVANYEAANSYPNLITALAIADALHVDIRRLVMDDLTSEYY